MPDDKDAFPDDPERWEKTPEEKKKEEEEKKKAEEEAARKKAEEERKRKEEEVKKKKSLGEKFEDWFKEQNLGEQAVETIKDLRRDQNESAREAGVDEPWEIPTD